MIWKVYDLNLFVGFYGWLRPGHAYVSNWKETATLALLIKLAHEETTMLIQENDRKALVEEFSGFTNTVKILFFTQASQCEYCADTETILKEVEQLSEKIVLEVLSLDTDKGMAGTRYVDLGYTEDNYKIPVLVVGVFILSGDAMIF